MENKISITKKISYFLLSFYIIFILLFTSAELLSVLKPLYLYEYSKYDVYQIEYVKDYEVSKVTDDIILYFADVTDNMNWRSFFRQREDAHMVDVKLLFTAGSYLRWIFIVLSALLYKKLAKQRNFMKHYRNSFFAVLGTAGLISLFAGSNFSSAFLKFHQILFNNDNWLLDPSESIIINLMPQGFFMDMALYIAVMSLILGILHFFILKYKQD